MLVPGDRVLTVSGASTGAQSGVFVPDVKGLPKNADNTPSEERQVTHVPNASEASVPAPSDTSPFPLLLLVAGALLVVYAASRE